MCGKKKKSEEGRQNGGNQTSEANIWGVSLMMVQREQDPLPSEFHVSMLAANYRNALWQIKFMFAWISEGETV